MRKRGFTAVEAAIVLVVLAIVVSVTMWQVDKARQARLRAESVANLMTLHVTLQGPQMYEGYSVPGGGYYHRWPLLSNTPGQLTPELSDEHVQALLKSEKQGSLISPAHPKAELMRREALANPEFAITDDSYWYLGYVTWSEDTGLALVEAYKETVAKTGLPPYGDVLKVVPLDAGMEDMTDNLPRIGKFPDNASLNDFWQPIPVMIERPGLQKGGSNVLFFGGAVTFMEYPGKWPMTEKFIKALESLDELKEPRSAIPEK